MEFSDIGAHCHYDLCKQHTYLPFECESCKHKYCKHHRTQKSHQCLKLKKEINEEKQSDINKINKNKTSKINNPKFNGGYKCNYKKCKKYEWVEFECNKCHKSFCLRHRSPDDHKCKPRKFKDDKNEKLRQQRQKFLNNLQIQTCSKQASTNNNNNQKEKPIMVQ